MAVPVLDVQNLTKSFGAQVLFENISFSIAEGQKVGLIAQNGTGKSTLLSVLTGKEGYDNGEIIYRRDLRVGMLEQTPVFDPEESVLDACFNHQGEPEKILKAKQILTQLKIKDLNQPMGQLSGGQQKRIALANVLITEPDFIILDEPTNHLDLEMIEWLEGYLNRGNRTLLMVTHDRFFLDRVCSIILSMSYIDSCILTSIRNASTIPVRRLPAPTTSIGGNWNGCAASPRHEATRPAIAKRLSMNWKRWPSRESRTGRCG